MIWPNKEPITIYVIDYKPSREWYCLNCKRTLLMPVIVKCLCPLCYKELKIKERVNMDHPTITCRCGQKYVSETHIRNDRGVVTLMSTNPCPSCLRHDNVAKASYNKEAEKISSKDIGNVK